MRKSQIHFLPGILVASFHEPPYRNHQNYKDDKHRSDLADELSRIFEKHIELDIVMRRGVKGVLDRESTALNKIQYDVRQVEREEEING